MYDNGTVGTRETSPRKNKPRRIGFEMYFVRYDRLVHLTRLFCQPFPLPLHANRLAHTSTVDPSCFIRGRRLVTRSQRVTFNED